MKHSKFDQTLALAGIYQAASLVKQIANTGSANEAQVEASIESLFRFDADTVEDVFGSIAGVSHGLKVLHRQITDRSRRDIEITQYVFSLILLERKLARRPQMLNEIEKRLKAIQAQFDFFSLNHPNTFVKLGQLYRDTISSIGPKIIVSGEQPYLSNETNASKVRALLLAGIRSAVLWQQCGGSRWQLLFGRRAYERECDRILATI